MNISFKYFQSHLSMELVNVELYCVFVCGGGFNAIRKLVLGRAESNLTVFLVTL